MLSNDLYSEIIMFLMEKQNHFIDPLFCETVMTYIIRDEKCSSLTSAPLPHNILVSPWFCILLQKYQHKGRTNNIDSKTLPYMEISLISYECNFMFYSIMGSNCLCLYFLQ